MGKRARVLTCSFQLISGLTNALFYWYNFRRDLESAAVTDQRASSHHQRATLLAKLHRWHAAATEGARRAETVLGAILLARRSELSRAFAAVGRAACLGRMAMQNTLWLPLERAVRRLTSNADMAQRFRLAAVRADG